MKKDAFPITLTHHITLTKLYSRLYHIFRPNSDGLLHYLEPTNLQRKGLNSGHKATTKCLYCDQIFETFLPTDSEYLLDESDSP